MYCEGYISHISVFPGAVGGSGILEEKIVNCTIVHINKESKLKCEMHRPRKRGSASNGMILKRNKHNTDGVLEKCAVSSFTALTIYMDLVL